MVCAMVRPAANSLESAVSRKVRGPSLRKKTEVSFQKAPVFSLVSLVCFPVAIFSRGLPVALLWLCCGCSRFFFFFFFFFRGFPAASFRKPARARERGRAFSAAPGAARSFCRRPATSSAPRLRTQNVSQRKGERERPKEEPVMWDSMGRSIGSFA